MRSLVLGLSTCLIFTACLSAAVVKGKVVDPSGAPIPYAEVAIVSRVGVEVQTTTARDGAFQFNTANPAPETKLTVTAPGFKTTSVALAADLTVQLEIAPQVDSVRVVGSAIDVPASEQGGSVSLVPSRDVRERNEPIATDLLRYLPGMAFNQSGATGGVTSLFLRGGYSGFSLVQIDGSPVNSFGGAFDYAHIPAEAVDHIEVIRGSQSSVYGPYANSGAINFVTRQPGAEPQLDLLAEGGSHWERRFGITGTATLGGFGLVLSASQFNTDGPVANSDYRNQDVMLHAVRRFGRQSLSFGGYFDSNEVGEPGAWGSDPKHTFSGIDTVSRAKNNFTNSWAHYEADLSPRVRQEIFGSFFLDNSGYVSPYGFSFNKDLRGQLEARTVTSISPHYLLAFGVSAGREDVRNTFITDNLFEDFPIRRNDLAVYVENRFEFGGRFYINAGLRGEFIHTPAIPPDGFSRPLFPADTISKVNPKVAAGYVAAPGTRLHTSFGMGIRPPSGFELAFTNNPSLKPERTRSSDVGIEQKLGNLLLDATFFYNRYYDLIVTLGGSLSSLSHYQSANIANSRAEGAEFSGSLRPARWMFLKASYTRLSSRILSLDGSNGLAPNPFRVGQQLTRRPENSGNLVASFTQGRISADVTGYLRGKTLYEEPAFGASNGLFRDAGFANFGLNLNYSLGHGVTAYGNVRNVLNRHYEEVFGFPSPWINFVAGVKWRIGKE